MRSNDDLRAEYILVQGQYEAFDQRALSLKALATPLLGAAIAIGFKERSPAILLATIFVAASLWVLEAIWKSFQYCFVGRIKELEAWFRGELPEVLAPFQIYRSWMISWNLGYCRPRSWGVILKQPFVCLPYVPIIVLCAVGCVIHVRS